MKHPQIQANLIPAEEAIALWSEIIDEHGTAGAVQRFSAELEERILLKLYPAKPVTQVAQAKPKPTHLRIIK